VKQSSSRPPCMYAILERDPAVLGKAGIRKQPGVLD
jgi:hypothetical protein